MLESLRAQDTAGLYMQAENFSRLVDFVPDLASTTNNQFARLSVMNNEGTLSERYEYILRMSQIMQTELPEDTKQKIEKFRGLLSVTKTKKNLIDDTETQVTEPSPLVVVYNQKMGEYENAALEYNSHRIDALTADNVKAVHYWAINANILRNKVKAAMADWVSNGYKNDYEQIAAFIDQVMQRDMALLKQQYRDDLEKARLTGMASGSDFFYTSLVPGNFMKASGWTEFGFSSSDFNTSSNSSYNFSRSSTSAAGGWLGIFGGGGSASSAGGQSQSNVRFDSSTFRYGLQDHSSADRASVVQDRFFGEQAVAIRPEQSASKGRYGQRRRQAGERSDSGLSHFADLHQGSLAVLRQEQRLRGGAIELGALIGERRWGYPFRSIPSWWLP